MRKEITITNIYSVNMIKKLSKIGYTYSEILILGFRLINKNNIQEYLEEITIYKTSLKYKKDKKGKPFSIKVNQNIYQNLEDIKDVLKDNNIRYKEFIDFIIYKTYINILDKEL